MNKTRKEMINALLNNEQFCSLTGYTYDSFSDVDDGYLCRLYASWILKIDVMN